VPHELCVCVFDQDCTRGAGAADRLRVAGRNVVGEDRRAVGSSYAFRVEQVARRQSSSGRAVACPGRLGASSSRAAPGQGREPSVGRRPRPAGDRRSPRPAGRRAPYARRSSAPEPRHGGVPCAISGRAAGPSVPAAGRPAARPAAAPRRAGSCSSRRAAASRRDGGSADGAPAAALTGCCRRSPRASRGRRSRSPARLLTTSWRARPVGSRRGRRRRPSPSTRRRRWTRSSPSSRRSPPGSWSCR
jgi:hypothetical protein